MGVLRKWFGPSRAEIWRQLNSEIGGTLVPGGFARGEKLHVTHGEWTVTLDTYVVSTGKTTLIFTRMRAPYVNPDGLRFTIYRRNFFSDMGKWFGMQDIEIGDAGFDHDFIIKATNEDKIKSLLASLKVRELIAKQPDIKFEVRDDEGWFGAKFPEGVDELHFTVLGVIKDVERLKLLYDLFAATLDELCRVGSAYEENPQVRL